MAISHERVSFDRPTEVPFDKSVSYWALPGRWKRLSSLQAGPGPAYQTHVWGSVEGADRIFDARTGKEVASGAAPGQYVAESTQLSAVSITGSYAAQGEPVRLDSDPRALTVSALRRERGEPYCLLGATTRWSTRRTQWASTSGYAAAARRGPWSLRCSLLMAVPQDT